MLYYAMNSKSINKKEIVIQKYQNKLYKSNHKYSTHSTENKGRIRRITEKYRKIFTYVHNIIER